MTKLRVALIGLLSLGGCDDDEEVVVDLGAADMAVADLAGDGAVTAETRTATLTGAQEVPAVETVYSGSSTVTINAAQDEITLTLSHTIPVASTTAAHIHIGAPGVSGPIIFPIAVGAGAVSSEINLTLTADDLTPQQGAQTFAEAVDAILTGQTYVNVHTTTFPDGEIRGQLVE